MLLQRFRLRDASHIALSLALALLPGAGSIAVGEPAAFPPGAVIIVRHAEKAAEPASDPPLSAAGEIRAAALAEALASAGLSAIITTEFRRTRETAAPAAAETRIVPTVIAAGRMSLGAHADSVAAAVRRAGGGTVLVVGHSNTVPAIIAALGAGTVREICDWEYSNFFVLVPAAQGMHLLRSSYGAADPAAADPARRPGAPCGMRAPADG